MPQHPAPPHRKRPWLWATLASALASVLTACGLRPAPTPPMDSRVARPPVSQAEDARAYRRDAARHLYQHNAHRIYQGQLPPMLMAVGVLQVHLGAQGQVRSLEWLRAPRHVPQVVAEIERTVHAAAPFPVALRLGAVTYTDTWLWDHSGQFQLDTLTEGQRSGG